MMSRSRKSRHKRPATPIIHNDFRSPEMRKVVFIGNCQGRRLQEFYRDNLSYLTGDVTDFIVGYEALDQRGYELLKSADVVVAQATDSERHVDVRTVDTPGTIILFPNVTGAFLWPFSG